MAPIFRSLLRWLALGGFLLLAYGLRLWNAPQVFHDGGVYFVDADCYSRMTRVARVLEHPLRAIGFHDFENAPLGTHPHTTAPMDLVIAGLTRGIAFGTGREVAEAADFAGAFVSPLLGCVLVGFLWWWARRLNLPFANAMLLVIAVSPILVHGFVLGRPDHQSLILLLVGVGLASEVALWTTEKGGWRFLGAAAWALALWTSLFEPLILLLAVLACRVFVLGRRAWSVRDWRSLALFVALLVFAVLFDGGRVQGEGTDRVLFFRWAQTIGELSHPQFVQLFPWTGWLLSVVPVLLMIRFGKERCRVSLALAVLVILTTALTLWYARWGYFLALFFALSLPWALSRLPWRPVVGALFLLSLWPMAREWDRQLFPNESTLARRAEMRREAVALRAVAERLRVSGPGVVLAPWWLSPAIAYWSGHPCVAGSSHQSLPGIVDTAKFFLATHPIEAKEILARRKVRWVLGDDPARVLPNSAQILGVPAPRDALGAKLPRGTAETPSGLIPLGTDGYYTLFTVDPDALAR